MVGGYPDAKMALRSSRPSVGRCGEGCKPRSLEPPATSPVSSAGGARGCGMEFEVPDGFRLSASGVRSARAERERPAEARVRVCD